jgi:hypothetical protein
MRADSTCKDDAKILARFTGLVASKEKPYYIPTTYKAHEIIMSTFGEITSTPKDAT